MLVLELSMTIRVVVNISIVLGGIFEVSHKI